MILYINHERMVITMKWETIDKINSFLSGYNDNSYWKMRFSLYHKI